MDGLCIHKRKLITYNYSVQRHGRQYHTQSMLSPFYSPLPITLSLSHTHTHSLSLSLFPPPSSLRHEMEAHYQVTDMKVMRLRSQETLSGRKEFIVVGTMATFGEEVSTKGKVCNYALL